MKAAVCREFGTPLVIEEIEIDPPKAGEVKVALAACAICHSDITYMNGGWGGTLPAVYGHEASGVVESIGPGVTRIAPGEHVIVTLLRSCGECFYCVQGAPNMCETSFPLDKQSCLRSQDGGVIHQGLRTAAFAEYAVVDQSQTAAIPKELPFDRASLLACGVITGFGAVVNTANVPSGSSVVVVGTGGVGLNSGQGAVLAGANPIIASDPVASKRNAAKTFGATDAIDPADGNAYNAVRTLTEGRGADYVFITVGSKTAIEQGVRLMRKAGTMVIVGMPPSGVMTEIETVKLADSGQRIIGSKMGSTRLREDIPVLVAHYQEGHLKLDELISGRYSLDQINDAIASVTRNEALRNVIVF